MMNLEYRKATIDDLDLLTKTRIEVLRAANNLDNLIDMSRQRMCSRAYLEYRLLFNQICIALSEYSEEWKTVVENYMHPKCEELGYCPEQHSCGRMPKRT